jgi:hypothetical protein
MVKPAGHKHVSAVGPASAVGHHHDARTLAPTPGASGEAAQRHVVTATMISLINVACNKADVTSVDGLCSHQLKGPSH